MSQAGPGPLGQNRVVEPSPTARRLAVTALGADRPGIVAALTEALADLQANLADTAMTRLGGAFAMILLVEVPPGTSTDAVRQVLATPAQRLGLVTTVTEAALPTSDDAGDRQRWVLSLRGADRPGIVHRVTAALAALGANVVDLSSRLVGPPDEAAYVLLVDLEVPTSISDAELSRALAEGVEGLDLAWHLRRSESDEL